MKQEILEECIESIDISNLIKEIIVLDDNSEDQTWFILEEISKINPKLTIKKGAETKWMVRKIICLSPTIKVPIN